MQNVKIVFLPFVKNGSKCMLIVMFIAVVSLFTESPSLMAQQVQKKIATSATIQKKTVTGIVVDASGESLPGVSIVVKGSPTIGTISDFDGNFKLEVPNKTVALVFSYVGFKTNEVALTRSALHIIMEDESVNMSEVVVVGYGKQKKATVTGAVASVATKELLQSSQANVSNALVGRMPGLSAVQKSGEPGKDQATIRIRGIGSFASSDNVDLQGPLVMVDGIETPNYNNIDPNEIDNVSILKDASATAVYGVRGANGVILITTKRGGISKPQVSLSTNFALQGFTDLRKPMNSYDWARSFNEAYAYDGYITGNYTPRYSDEELQKFRDHSDPVFFPDTDWISIMFKDYTTQSQHNININGGSEKVKYFVSLGYFNQEGMFNNTNLLEGYDTQVKYNRYNFRTNFDFQVTRDLSLSLNVSDQLSDHNSPNNSTEYILANAFAHPPTSGPGIIDGKIINNLVGRYDFCPNPILGLVQGNGHYKDYSNQLNGSIRINYKFDALVKGLSAHATISYQNYNFHRIRYVKSAVTYDARPNPDTGAPIFIPVGESGSFSLNESFSKNRKLYIEAGLDYSRTFAGHTIGGLLLYNQSKYYSPDLAYLIPNGYQGVVGRITYDYKNRYLAEINAGYNGTENFAPKKRFGFFPAYSLGWVVSEENFFPKNNIVSFIKIRGSYGEVGNDKIGGQRFLYRPTAYIYYRGGDGPTVTSPSYNFGEVGNNYTNYVTSSEGKMGNPDLTWERSTKMNIGVDLSIWNDRIKITADLFKERRKDILTNRASIPIIVGADMPAYNMGEMENGGFDGEITFRDKVGGFNYWVKGIYTFARNKILFMDEITPTYSYMKRTGQQFNQYFGFIAEGFYNTWEEVNDVNRPVSIFNNNKIQPGDVKYKDVDGNGKIDLFDQVPIGYSDFPEISYGISLGGDYKGFDFSVLFQGANNVSFRASKKSNRGFQEDGSAVDYLKDYSWTPERYATGANIRFPHLSASAQQVNNYQSSTLWVRDASYLRLKNIEVGYAFTGNLIHKIGIQSARIYINANNLFTWDHLFPGEDPEIPTYNDGNYEPYPIIRTMNFGLNIKF